MNGAKNKTHMSQIFESKYGVYYIVYVTSYILNIKRNKSYALVSFMSILRKQTDSGDIDNYLQQL